MTTDTDRKAARTAAAGGTEASQGVNLSFGFDDPTGEFPRPPYFFSSNINFAATGGTVNSLYLGGGDTSVPLDIPLPGPSQYPLNQVQETASGHIIEVDDTPGNERILIRHNSGAGIELTNDGHMAISARNNRVDVVGGGQTVIVEGDAELIYRGNLNLKVTGDLNIDCLNYNVNARGNKTENISGASTSNITRNRRENVGGSRSTAVAGRDTTTILNGSNTSVGGNYILNTTQQIGIFAGDKADMTADKVNISANDANIGASNLSVFGATGTIGGDDIYAYFKNARIKTTVYAGTSVDAPQGRFTRLDGTSAHYTTFHGDLTGKAARAGDADTSAALGPGGGSSTTVTAAQKSNDASGSARPTADNLSAYLTRSTNGIRRILVDAGNFIRNSLNRTETNGGVTDNRVTTSVARSALRDGANAANATFISNAVAEGALSPEYSRITPRGINRIITGSSTPRFGQQTLGNIAATSTADPFLPRRGTVNLVPDPKYNPDFVSNITISTKLAPGVTIAKFFGTQDATPLDFIRSPAEKKKLARHLYLHAEVIRSIQTNETDFANFRLNVVEGVYRPGPTETVTAGSINDLKLKGRAVVYELVDSNGNTPANIMFDLAEYWKETLYFDRMILSYDNFDSSGAIKATLVLIMPEISDTWTGTFNRSVETQYNNNPLSEGELVECTNVPSTGGTNPEASNIVLDDDTEYGINLTPGQGAIVDTLTGTKSSVIQPGALRNLQRLLEGPYQDMQRYFGGPIYINDALTRASSGRGSSSQHNFGKAIDVDVSTMSLEERDRLVQAALAAGFTGIGFYRTFLHVDLGPSRYWTGQGAVSFGTKTITQWAAIV
jgi:hypothetical protein